MANPFDEAEYLPIPELSPYVRHDRYDRPKEAFKQVAPEECAPFFAKLAEVRRTHRNLSTRFSLLDSQLDWRRAELMYRVPPKGAAHGAKGGASELVAEFTLIATFAREQRDWELIGWKTFITK